jgi:hypothetical protein
MRLSLACLVSTIVLACIVNISYSQSQPNNSKNSNLHEETLTSLKSKSSSKQVASITSRSIDSVKHVKNVANASRTGFKVIRNEEASTLVSSPGIDTKKLQAITKTLLRTPKATTPASNQKMKTNRLADSTLVIIGN